MAHEKITIISDWMDTIYDMYATDQTARIDPALLKRLIELRENKHDVMICSSQKPGIIADRLAGRFSLDNGGYISDEGKGASGFWKHIATDRQLDKSRTLILDDSLSNCQAAREAGFNAIQWKFKDEDCLEQFDNELQKMGYHPN